MLGPPRQPVLEPQWSEAQVGGAIHRADAAAAATGRTGEEGASRSVITRISRVISLVGPHRNRVRHSEPTPQRLKEEWIHLHDCEALAKARAVTGAFIERYNNGWPSSGTGS